MKTTIRHSTDLSKYFFTIGKRLLLADVVLVDNEYHLDNIRPYNKKLDCRISYGRSIITVILSYFNTKITNIRLPLVTLRSSLTGEKQYRYFDKNRIITTELIEKEMTAIKMRSKSIETKKQILADKNTDIILSMFKELIDKRKLVCNLDLTKLPVDHRMLFYSYDWGSYIIDDIDSCYTCNKEFTFKLFKGNIEKLIDDNRTEVVGFRTAQKFIDVFLNV